MFVSPTSPGTDNHQVTNCIHSSQQPHHPVKSSHKSRTSLITAMLADGYQPVGRGLYQPRGSWTWEPVARSALLCGGGGGRRWLAAAPRAKAARAIEKHRGLYGFSPGKESEGWVWECALWGRNSVVCALQSVWEPWEDAASAMWGSMA